MTMLPLTVSTGDDCRSALRLMSSARVDHLAVVDGDRLVGVVSECDIYRGIARFLSEPPTSGEDSVLSYVNVGGVMRYASVTIEPTASLTEAVTLMLERGVQVLPVVENGRVVGTLTSLDALRMLLEAIRNEAARAG